MSHVRAPLGHASVRCRAHGGGREEVPAMKSSARGREGRREKGGDGVTMEGRARERERERR